MCDACLWLPAHAGEAGPDIFFHSRVEWQLERNNVPYEGYMGKQLNSLTLAAQKVGLS